MAALQLDWASECEAGRRSANDDCVLADPENGIYVVCDGASARIGGKTAAEIACRVVKQSAPDISRKLAGKIGDEAPRIAEDVLQAAHRAIVDEQQKQADLSGMTTTIAMVLHRGNEVLLSHVGDSRVYIYRDPELRLMTRDHSLEDYLRENPEAKPKVKLPGKTLVRALGLKNAQLGARHKRVTLAEGDGLLICSDGLSDAVAPWIMREIIAGLPELPVTELARAFTTAALAHGTTDNISVVLLSSSTDAERNAPTTRYDFESMSLGSSASRPNIRLGWLAFLEGPSRGKVTALEANVIIGADPGCTVVLQEPYVSTRHAEIRAGEDGFELRDLGSTNGTYVNDIRVQQTALVDGDVIRFGKAPAVFKSHLLSGQ
jgi:serine/threonine protein phosphatase PrpC